MNQNLSNYGENQGASQRYVNGLNSATYPFATDGVGISSWINSQTDSPTGGFCAAANEIDVGPEIDTQMTNEDRAFLDSEVGDPPPKGGAVRTQLPDVSATSEDVYKYGYYRYKDGDGKVYGTNRTIWRLRAAGKLLAKERMVMGVGDISTRGGPTRGHAEHQTGKDVDLRLMNSNGVATACSVGQSCYDRGKTFKMIKTLIDVDPTQVDKILINDATLRSQINNYYQAKTGDNRNVARSCSGHHNHVHFSWK